MTTLEQQARDMLERAGVESAQSMTSGDLVEVANMMSEVYKLRAALERARALLAELEWCGVDNWLECPWCLGTKAEHYGEPAGHKPNCKLAAFLAAGGER